MHTIRVKDVLNDRILVTRESAHLLEERLRRALTEASAGGELRAVRIRVDFEDVEGMAPSFLDELLVIFDSLLASESAGGASSLVIAHPPSRLSSKFEAVARGHGMSVSPLSDGAWELTKDVRKEHT